MASCPRDIDFACGFQDSFSGGTLSRIRFVTTTSSRNSLSMGLVMVVIFCVLRRVGFLPVPRIRTAFAGSCIGWFLASSRLVPVVMAYPCHRIRQRVFIPPFRCHVQKIVRSEQNVEPTRIRRIGVEDLSVLVLVENA